MARRGGRSGNQSVLISSSVDSVATNNVNADPIQTLRTIGLDFCGFKGRQNVRERTNNDRFSSGYGVSANTLHAVFQDVQKNHPKLTAKYFLMGVDSLKRYDVEHNMAGKWKVCEDTFRTHWKKTVRMIAELRGEKIKFDPADFPEDQIFLMTVDGVHFRIREPRRDPGSKWYSHKFHGAGVMYLVAVDIRRSRILWIDGPKPASTSERATFEGGLKKDKSKDPNALASNIPADKRAVADSALRTCQKATTRMTGQQKELKDFLRRATARQETLFKRFKQFNILSSEFRHGFDMHKDVLDAIAVITQYDMNLGNPLFDV